MSAKVSKKSKQNALGAPKTKQKQMGLFSFFKKKTPTETVAKATGTAKTNGSSKDDGGSSAKKSNSASSQQQRSVSSTVVRNSDRMLRGIKVNSKIAVFWPDDGKYYPGKVTQIDALKQKWQVTYDDDSNEWIDLRREKFRLIDNDDEEEDLCDTSDEMEEDKVVKQTSQQKGRPAKRPRISDSDDEEEFEMDDNPEAAVDEEELEDMEEEEEEEELVYDDDDDEEEPAVAKKRKTPAKNRNSRTTDKTTPKVSVSMYQPCTATPPNNTTAPTSLESFSAFNSKPGSQVNTPTRITPPSFSKATSSSAPKESAKLSADEDMANGEKALPFIESVVNPAGAHVHNHLKFLRNPKDAQGRSKGDPGYNARTLRWDRNEFLECVNRNKPKQPKKMSPGVEQWWKTKAQYFDTVLLFKTGKFYEMFHMDADIGVQHAGLSYMKGHVAHAGFPEVSYATMADKLVRAGYKVARCEQTETPDALKERKKKQKGIPNVVNREVCSIMTVGTRTCCYLDGDLSINASGEAGIGPLLAIKEKKIEQSTQEDDSDQDGGVIHPVCEYGIVAVDASRAEITMGQFADDAMRTRLHTLLSTLAPSEVLVEGSDHGSSKELLSVLKTARESSPFLIETVEQNEAFPKSTALDPSIRRKLDRNNGKAQPWNVEETMAELHRRQYFPRGSKQNHTSTSRWPSVLQMAVEGNAELALSSLGAVLFYLQRNLIDEEILSMGLIKAYIPAEAPEDEDDKNGGTAANSPDKAAQRQTQGDAIWKPTASQDGQGMSDEETTSHMAIDGNTLCQLEILTNSIDHKEAGSLWSKINFTKTPHGTRLLKAWVLRPLFQKAEIDRRADAVEELGSGDAAMAMDEAKALLSKCGDIERLLARIHAMSGTKCPGSDESEGMIHPSSRAVLYETKTYTKRKVGDFKKVLTGLRSASKIPELFADIDVSSPLLRKLVKTPNDGGCFPDVGEELDFFFETVDFAAAEKGEWEPGRGIDELFDEACDAIDQIHRELEQYKDEMCAVLTPKSLARSSWKYSGLDLDSKDKYIIELPIGVTVPTDFRMVGKRGKGQKQICKYQSSVVQELVVSLEQAIEAHKERKAQHMQHVFARFDAKRNLWEQVKHVSAMLDALGSLAHFCGRPGYCRPQILECPPDATPCIEIVQGRHPCVESTPGSGEFIPNDLSLGSSERDVQAPLSLLLSGPNMGGKSTLLRQTCLISILAQIGGYVPAEACTLTPVDRIMTRLGASDRILLGYSTFFCELFETASALRSATRRSLIIFDELGRGTNTWDGTAIASACLSYIVDTLKCLSLFATHYHSLLDDKKSDPNVRLGHMENSVNKADDTVTFHYTLGNGACPKSFGVSCARIAGLPDEVLKRAQALSSQFETEASQQQNVIKMINEGSCKLTELEELWDSLQGNSMDTDTADASD
ncbi:protein MutS [Seminavis robusta]|uniref:DNA mismatch repair protein n=1 Tax=Seminavis robusta TaxID=568900 RepID=A0A9N8EH25_9STRA|nr:protein MutS [Seminavis robusta]|eukprot:Sro1192_g251010.1 protein MutS (1424) ;mRNA; f:3551-7895